MQLDQQILAAVNAADYQPLTVAALGKQLGVTKRRIGDYRTALELLLDQGMIRKARDGFLRPVRAETVTGVISKIASGAAFLRIASQEATSRSEDVYISPESLGDAHTGDEVLVRLLPRSSGGRRRGRVVEVVRRGRQDFVGTYTERDGQGYVEVDGAIFKEPILVGDPGAKGAQPQDMVVFEMLRFPTHDQTGEGVLTRVLGARGTPGVDTLSIIYEFGLPDEFPEEVLAESRAAAANFSETQLEGRVDLTNELIITIDPFDARDFDDAISLTKHDDGSWTLGVHIADVSHFVPPGSALDREAAQRGTSVYLPDRVLPMLPEIISNGLASLQQDRVRFTKSAIISYSPDGVVTHAEFQNTAIRNKRRFAYEEVMPIVRGAAGARETTSPEITVLLVRMHELAMLLRRRRHDLGSLELSLPEVKVDFDRDGKVTGAHVAHHDESHEIIEEFMLAANIAVATELDRRGIPFARRVHRDPDLQRLKTLGEFAASLGYPLKRVQSRHDLQQLIERVRGTPYEQAINFALLRSLKQAEYSPEALGHYALAVDHYCHFTSPIRRYPDLMVHRLMDQLARHGRVKKQDESVLEKATEHCSLTERRAEKAERELKKVKLLTYLANHIGEEMEAIITGVQEWGLYCQGIELPAEGLVHTTTLDNDHYYYEAAAHALIGRQSGRQYRLGDRVRIVVARVDINRRILEFRLAGTRAAFQLKLRLEKGEPAPQIVHAGGRPGAKASAPRETTFPDDGRKRRVKPRGKRSPAAGNRPPKKTRGKSKRRK